MYTRSERERETHMVWMFVTEPWRVQAAWGPSFYIYPDVFSLSLGAALLFCAITHSQSRRPPRVWRFGSRNRSRLHFKLIRSLRHEFTPSEPPSENAISTRRGMGRKLCALHSPAAVIIWCSVCIRNDLDVSYHSRKLGHAIVTDAMLKTANFCFFSDPQNLRAFKSSC